MRQAIVIIGALPNDPKREELLSKLEAAASQIAWDWIQAPASTSRPDDKYVRPLIAKGVRKQLTNTTVVKLPMLHGATKNQVHKLGCSVVEAPATSQTLGQLIDWLLSPDANLFPRQEWMVGTREAAFLAIISKLIRGCRWAKDVSGHSFLKKNDLVNQSPVQRSGFEEVRVSAIEQIPMLIANGILLRKGAEQGSTPLEYAINTKHLQSLKQMMTSRSLVSLSEPAFKKTIDYINLDKSPTSINALDGIVNQQTLEQCIVQHGSGDDRSINDSKT